MSNPIINIKEMRYQWPNQDSDTLNIPSLTIEAGERLFIQGPSGSGKTTLLNIMGAVTPPSAGDLTVLGQNLSMLNGAARDKFRADHIGFIFQQFNLIPYLSTVENILLPYQFSAMRKRKCGNAVEAKSQAKKLLSRLHLDDANIHNRRVNELSVGQQQRVAAARAMMGRPEIIIADEPTSAMDADAREAFIKLLFDECAQSESTLIFVSHDRSLAQLFDRNINLTDINKN